MASTGLPRFAVVAAGKPADIRAQLRKVRDAGQVDSRGRTRSEFSAKAIIASDPDEHVERLGEMIGRRATILAVMNCSGAYPEGAIRVYRKDVLPQLAP
jgi:hypothetical protein